MRATPFWPAVVTVAVPLALVAFRVSPLGPDFLYVVVGVPVLLLFWAASAIVAAVVAARAMRNRHWRRAAFAAILPLAVVAASVRPFAFIRGCNIVGDRIHFEIVRPRYLAQIKALPGDGPKLVVFDWGGMIWASSGVVYDDSDQVALPPERQSADWLEQAGKSELSCEGYRARPVGGHFYLVDFPC